MMFDCKTSVQMMDGHLMNVNPRVALQLKLAFLVEMKARGNESGERIRQSRRKFMMKMKQTLHYKSFYIESKVS